MKVLNKLRGALVALFLCAPLAAMAATPVFINELHYDNAGADTGEAIEIAGPVGTDLTGWSVVLYNGNNGESYDTLNLARTIPTDCSGADGVVVLMPGSIQNGAADGLALVDASGNVVQFLSYEGTLTAANGPAAGMTSTDIGVAESGSTPAGDSLQLTGSGSDYQDFTWSGPTSASFASCNAGQSFPAAAPPAPASAFINELHYDNAGADSNEAIEIAGPAGADLSGWSIVLYNGSDSSPYDTLDLSGTIPASCGAGGVLVVTPSSIQNGAPDGLALVDAGGNVVQFLSYEGTLTAVSGPAAGMTSTDIGVAESGSTAAGDSLQLTGSGTSYADFTWIGPTTASFGSCNAGQSFSGSSGNPPPDNPPTVVSTDPTDGSGAFPTSGNLSVTFSEPVSLASGWYSLICDTSGSHDGTVSGSGASYTLDPSSDFTALEACTLTVVANDVHDLDGTPDPMAANVVVNFTVGTSDDGYYAGVDTSSGPALEAWLHTRVTTAPSPYTQIKAYPYTGSGTDTWTILGQADQDPDNPSNILDLYKNESYVWQGGGVQDYNREHTWPKSIGFPEETINGDPNPPYTDTHMLHLADGGYNSARGNGMLGDCVPPLVCTPLWTVANDGFGGDQNNPDDANWKSGNRSDDIYQVWAHRKGDVARAVMYMAVRYDGGYNADGQCEPDLKLTNNASLVTVMDAQTAPGCSGSANVAYYAMLDALLEWNNEDPPDAAERLRNNIVFSYQHNRNPFIDHPEWAQCVFTNTNCPGATP